MPVLVYDSGFSVKYIGQFIAVDGVHHLLQRIILMKTVACIQETEIITAGKGDALIHSVIQSFVGFADDGVYA